MATQVALHTHDILHAIFEYFSVDRWQYRFSIYRRDNPGEDARRQALARSARVCKAFRDAALPILWGRLHNLVPFFRLLSTCIVIKESPMGPKDRKKCIYSLAAGPVRPGELQRLRAYGALIHTVGGSTQASFTTKGFFDIVDGSSLAILSALVGDTPEAILPNLRSLSWPFSSTSDPMALRVLLSPSIKSLHFETGSERVKWQPLLEQVLHASLRATPHLDHLTINCAAHFCDLRLSSSTTLLISELRSLRSLVLLFPTYEDWNAISSDVMLDALSLLAPLTTLERLEFRPGYVIETSKAPSWSSTRRSLFPNLQELKLHRVNCRQSLHHLFEMLQTETLRSFEATFDYANDTACHKTFESLARCFPGLRSLRCIMKYMYEERNQSSSSAPSLRELISPLLTVHCMEAVILPGEIRPRCTVGDTDLDAMSAAWPRLRILDLGEYPFTPSPRGLKGIGINTLALFATRCPNLERLSLSSFDMQSLDALVEPHDELPCTKHGLRHISFRALHGTEDGCIRCAHILDRLFPHLSVVDTLVGLIRPGRTSTMDLYAQPRWKGNPDHILKYSLFLSILTYQDTRWHDPWVDYGL
ncbi:hypothetical protein C8Q73DRAFT_792805 [Cubamyces lactineus]|nr:hypothetical protein C8Q73DRAFT_792805 [Cubamyces lactineus]